MLNNGLYMQVFLWMTLVVCGMVQYFTGIGAILWLPFLLAIVMLLLMLLQTRYSPFFLDHQERIIMVIFIALFVMSTLSTLLQSGLVVTIVGLKNELAIGLVLFCLLLGFCRESQIYRLTQSLYWIFYAQFPVMFYQLLVVVPQRVAIKGEFEMWDSVVGTFGGDPMGGGNTAALGLFCLLIMLLKVSEYKHGVASKLSTALHITAAFALCVLGEVKFVILIAPMLLAFVWFVPSFMRGMKRYNAQMVLMMLGGIIVLLFVAIMLLAASYESALDADASKGSLTIFLDSLEYIFDPNYIMDNGELGRMTTIFFWLNNSDLYGIPNLLFGYGLNTTNHGSAVAPGFLNEVFNVLLDSTSLSMMLWEIGLIGTCLYLLLIGLVIWVSIPKPVLDAQQLDWADKRLVAYQPAYLAFGLAGLMSIPYSQVLMLVPMMQFMFFFSLGAALVIRKSALAAREFSYE
ncbi:capsular biosynthesis protein [Vibrio cincinnatiensis]|uniref:capsular biosynthesis protein n=1 Tax=Vibrio cincinnatiensis TaxID=675 RepID=UPI001EDC9784|nr:capsular biosynthesis protein [Vibrio cincinnatiensis]MCG3726172.1 capsular biosynthesis protein [Vibrio cincinnatiensis]